MIVLYFSFNYDDSSTYCDACGTEMFLEELNTLVFLQEPVNFGLSWLFLNFQEFSAAFVLGY